MGWKSVKDHYRIGHIVKIVDGDIHIGSPYVGNLLQVAPDGTTKLNRTFRREGDIARYMDEIEADPRLFTRLLAAEDELGETIPVFTWSGAEIIEKRSEAIGWPNVCDDGELQYDNRHFATRDEAVDAALRDARSWAERAAEHVVEAEERLAERTRARDDAAGVLARLEADHPGR